MYTNSFTRALMVMIIILSISILLALPAQALMLVSSSQEVKIGKEVEKDVIRQYGGLSQNSTLVSRVDRVGKSVAAQSPRKNINYTYKVLNSDVINAYAAPGGPVLITKKLVQVLSTDDELAFVLAHETGHIAAEHGREAINRSLLASGIASILFRGASNTVQLGTNIMYTLYDRGYSRNQEYQADSYGVQIMTGAGYKPAGAVKALAKLGMQRTGGVNKYLSTHPDVPDRIHRVAGLAGISAEQEQALIRQAQTEYSKK